MSDHLRVKGSRKAGDAYIVGGICLSDQAQIFIESNSWVFIRVRKNSSTSNEPLSFWKQTVGAQTPLYRSCFWKIEDLLGMVKKKFKPSKGKLHTLP
jgi:hypothetical protein